MKSIFGDSQNRNLFESRKAGESVLVVNQRHGRGGGPFLAAFKAHMLGGGGFDGDLLDAKAEDRGDTLAHLRDIGGDFGTLQANRGIDIADGVMMRCQQIGRAFQQDGAVDVLVGRILVREMLPYVAQGGGSEQGIGNGMKQDIGIGMS